MKSSKQIRQEFFDFFKSKGHTIVKSAPVIPFDDPTLLFTNAGMNQFKDVFLGTGKREFTRCANTQKCIRVSGKHNDLEEVGHDGYHHTFFEMLGNWSFGDYYKKEAIIWAWELFTTVWNLPKERLWATVYNTDDESFNYWKQFTDINPDHILKFGDKDNFWEMGETGPCGPCSEIHIDLTDKGCKKTDVNSGNPEVIELWNLVFIQYNRQTDKSLIDLPQKHVDTGMGFERIVRVLQGKNSNYETDVFLPLINELINITGKNYSGNKYQSAMNVIADHIRTLTIAIADGALPSNEGRGYVLRRILRRAARYGRNLNMREPFIYKLVIILCDTLGTVFPEVIEKRILIEEVVLSEEKSFNETLDRGLVLFNEEIEKMTLLKSKIFSGEIAFKLHDTFGFPVDLTQLMAKEIGFEVDTVKFDVLMNEQKNRARSARESSDNLVSKAELDFEPLKGCYNPYDINEKGIEVEILKHSKLQDSDLELITLDKNPYYIESGGQVSDIGKLVLENGTEIIVDKPFNQSYLYINGPVDSDLNQKKAIAFIDYPRRQSIQRNHSATHLVHEALRRVLGSHIKQMGSYLDDKFLRFDFPHFHKLNDDEIKAVEEIVNGKINDDIVVLNREMSMEDAKKAYPNLRMFFGDKYGDDVRVILIDEKFSVELCGGTHVKNTSDIGLFKIVKEESISSGTRRIFAKTGTGIVDFINDKILEIEKISSELPEKYFNDFKSGINNLKSDITNIDYKDKDILQQLINNQYSTIKSLYELREKYLDEKKQADKKLAKLKVKEAVESLPVIISNSASINGLKLVTSGFNVDNMDELKEIGDALRVKIGSGAGFIYSIIDNKVNLVTVVTDDLIKEKKLNAGKIAGEIAKLLGGGGGGKPHLATAGGKDIDKIDFAVSEFINIIKLNLENKK